MPVRLALAAMGTRFEAVLDGADVADLEAAGEAALEEVLLWERRLSLFRRDSQVSLVNREAGRGWTPVAPEVLELFELCDALHEETGGRFDPALGGLMAEWGFRGEAPCPAQAGLPTGWNGVSLDREQAAVRLDNPEIQLDLGGIGKGWALDCAAEVLRDIGIPRALLHGGTSTALAIGAPPDLLGWGVLVPHPDRPKEALVEVALVDGHGLSVSAGHGRAVEGPAGRATHVMDPRSGGPASGPRLSAVIDASAARADAWSTALLVEEGAEGRDALVLRWDGKTVGWGSTFTDLARTEPHLSGGVCKLRGCSPPAGSSSSSSRSRHT